VKLPKNVELAIEEFVKACKRKFKKDLVSIVLFGSYARGTATLFSDIDILLVVKNLPKNTWERDKLMDRIVLRILFNRHKRISPILVTPEELERQAKWPNPLFYGILLGYECLHGKESFENIMKIVKQRVLEKKPVYVEGGKKWELAKMM